MSSKVTKVTKTTKTVVEASGESHHTETGETKTALLTTSVEKQADNNGKNGSHDATSTTVTMEYADGENTPDSNKMNRKLSHIKKRVSQEFTKGSECRKWVTWLIHLVGATVPYIAILVGAIYRDECNANPRIPLQLIVSGVVLAILHLSTSIDMYRRLSYLKGREKPAIFTITSLFLFIWMILGCVWVFSIFTPEFDPGSYAYNQWGYNQWGLGYYCHRGLYWFAVVFNLAFLVALVVSFLLCCCACDLLCNITILTCLCTSRRGRDEEEASTPVQV